MPLSLRLDTSADNVRLDIPDASTSGSGAMSATDKEKLDSLNVVTTVVQQLDDDIPAPTTVTISRYGAVHPPNIIVPAGASGFFYSVSGLFLLRTTVDVNMLILGATSLDDVTASAILFPNSVGRHTVIPGHELRIVVAVLSLYTADFVGLTATTAADWGAQIQYYFT